MMTRKAAIATATAVTVSTKLPSAPEEFADTIYFGGPIVTKIQTSEVLETSEV